MFKLFTREQLKTEIRKVRGPITSCNCLKKLRSGFKARFEYACANCNEQHFLHCHLVDFKKVSIDTGCAHSLCNNCRFNEAYRVKFRNGYSSVLPRPLFGYLTDDSDSFSGAHPEFLGPEVRKPLVFEFRNTTPTH